MPKFKASLWKRTEDHESEITLVLKVPLSDKDEALNFPTQTELDVTIEYEDR